MFTGIVQSVGKVVDIDKSPDLFRFIIQDDLITKDCKIGSSISVNGVCLTVVDVQDNRFSVEAVQETLKKTGLGKLEVGSRVHLEPALRVSDRFDGHMVQGHVDTTAKLVDTTKEGESFLLSFELDKPSPFMVEKGSICLNGISLTLISVETGKNFSVVIIPHTWENTSLSELKKGASVNVEFDIICKYLHKISADTRMSFYE